MDCVYQSLHVRCVNTLARSPVCHNQRALILIINRPILNYYLRTVQDRFSSDLRTFLRYSLDLAAAPPEMA